MDKYGKRFIAFWAFSWVLCIAFWGCVGFVAFHFISKWW